MAELDAYRDDILALRSEGMAQAEIIRTLKDRYGIEAKRSTLSDYLKSLPLDPTPATGSTSSALPTLTLPEEDYATALMQSALAEILDRLAQLVADSAALRRDGDERHESLTATLEGLRLRDALERHAHACETLYEDLRATAMTRIWLRASLLTGAAWGVLVGAVWLVG